MEIVTGWTRTCAGACSRWRSAVGGRRVRVHAGGRTLCAPDHIPLNIFFWQLLEAEIIQPTQPAHPAPIPSMQVRVGAAVRTPEGPQRHRWNRDEKLDPLGQ
jgi:hypothetical protein